MILRLVFLVALMGVSIVLLACATPVTPKVVECGEHLEIAPPYEELLRNPSLYAGKCFIFSGNVHQRLTAEQFVVGKNTKATNDYASLYGENNYDQILVIGHSDCLKQSGETTLAEDSIHFVGKYEEVYEGTTTLGASNPTPLIYCYSPSTWEQSLTDIEKDDICRNEPPIYEVDRDTGEETECIKCRLTFCQSELEMPTEAPQSSGRWKTIETPKSIIVVPPAGNITETLNPDDLLATCEGFDSVVVQYLDSVEDGVGSFEDFSAFVAEQMIEADLDASESEQALWPPFVTRLLKEGCGYNEEGWPIPSR